MKLKRTEFGRSLVEMLAVIVIIAVIIIASIGLFNALLKNYQRRETVKQMNSIVTGYRASALSLKRNGKILLKNVVSGAKGDKLAAAGQGEFQLKQIKDTETFVVISHNIMLGACQDIMEQGNYDGVASGNNEDQDLSQLTDFCTHDDITDKEKCALSVICSDQYQYFFFEKKKCPSGYSTSCSAGSYVGESQVYEGTPCFKCVSCPKDESVPTNRCFDNAEYKKENGCEYKIFPLRDCSCLKDSKKGWYSEDYFKEPEQLHKVYHSETKEGVDYEVLADGETKCYKPLICKSSSCPNKCCIKEYDETTKCPKQKEVSCDCNEGYSFDSCVDGESYPEDSYEHPVTHQMCYKCKTCEEPTETVCIGETVAVDPITKCPKQKEVSCDCNEGYSFDSCVEGTNYLEASYKHPARGEMCYKCTSCSEPTETVCIGETVAVDPITKCPQQKEVSCCPKLYKNKLGKGALVKECCSNAGEVLTNGSFLATEKGYQTGSNTVQGCCPTDRISVNAENKRCCASNQKATGTTCCALDRTYYPSATEAKCCSNKKYITGTENNQKCCEVTDKTRVCGQDCCPNEQSCTSAGICCPKNQADDGNGKCINCPHIFSAQNGKGTDKGQCCDTVNLPNLQEGGNLITKSPTLNTVFSGYLKGSTTQYGCCPISRTYNETCCKKTELATADGCCATNKTYKKDGVLRCCSGSVGKVGDNEFCCEAASNSSPCGSECCPNAQSCTSAGICCPLDQGDDGFGQCTDCPHLFSSKNGKGTDKGQCCNDYNLTTVNPSKALFFGYLREKGVVYGCCLKSKTYNGNTCCGSTEVVTADGCCEQTNSYNQNGTLKCCSDGTVAGTGTDQRCCSSSVSRSCGDSCCPNAQVCTITNQCCALGLLDDGNGNCATPETICKSPSTILYTDTTYSQMVVCCAEDEIHKNGSADSNRSGYKVGSARRYGCCNGSKNVFACGDSCCNENENVCVESSEDATVKVCCPKKKNKLCGKKTCCPEDQACAGNTCCKKGEVECNGSCCDGTCTNGVCCASGTTACGSTCCSADQSCQNGICCPSGQTNCGGSCCTGKCTNGSCRKTSDSIYIKMGQCWFCAADNLKGIATGCSYLGSGDILYKGTYSAPSEAKKLIITNKQLYGTSDPACIQGYNKGTVIDLTWNKAVTFSGSCYSAYGITGHQCGSPDAVSLTFDIIYD